MKLNGDTEYEAVEKQMDDLFRSVKLVGELLELATPVDAVMTIADAMVDPTRGEASEQDKRHSGMLRAVSEAIGCPYRRVRVEFDYKLYLKSPEWKARRERCLDAANGRCQVCNADQNLHVHHRTYKRIGDEWPDDLTVLCGACHELFHKHGKLAPAVPDDEEGIPW